MGKLTSDEIGKREALKRVMSDELFPQAMYDVKRQLADEMLRTNDRDARDKLFFESSLLNRLESRLTEYTNELLFLDVKKREEEAA